MSLRAPSLQSSYDDFFSGDPALIPQPVEPVADADSKAKAAYKAAVEEYLTKLRVARDTGNWAEILVGTDQPARFVMKPLTGSAYRAIVDASSSDKAGPGVLNQIAFRACITKVVDSGLPASDVIVKRVRDPLFGELATATIADYLDAIDVRIVSELGGEAMRRVTIGPKS